jgi:hypothetical protein
VVTGHELVARARKAFRLYDVIVTGFDRTPAFPLTAANIHLICTDAGLAPFRHSYERLAKVHQASETTWAIVEGLLTEHYLAPESNVVDPFFHV